MKKLSLLAVSMAVILAGCNSSSSSSGGDNGGGETEISGRFIDAAVEGMYYTTSSGKSGVTGVEGEFDATSTDTITFYIGGENGLKVGAASARDVLTPFEAAGKYNRALNLAILLQSIDNQFPSGSDLISIPESLRTPSQKTLELLADLNLDEYETVEDFLLDMGIAASNIASEEEALAHMDGAFGSMERGDETVNPLMKPGTFLRYIDVNQRVITDNYAHTFVHADKIIDKDLFERTRGMTEMTFHVESATSVLELAGSNDYTISGNMAEDYLSCIDADSEWDDNNENCQDDTVNPNPDFSLIQNSGNHFSYAIRDSEKSLDADTPLEDEMIEQWMPFAASTIAELNHYTPENIWDDGENDKVEWINEIASGSFDPVTGIYTQVVNKQYLDGDDCDSSACEVKHSTQRVAYYYEVASADQEKYVDFTGTWSTSHFCDNGEIAISTMAFDATGATFAGQECRSENGSPSKPSTPGDSGEHHEYGELAAIDYWWFGQEGRASKATLTELNTVVRFCDDDDFAAGESCPANKEYFIKWEYQPAGTNWDEGLLTRRKMDRMGNDISRVSIMQKVN